MPQKFEVMVGNKAVAHAVRLARAKFISAFPITPQTTIVQYIADMVANGEIDAEFVTTEGELTAQASAFSAGAAGVRAFTATAGPGLLYMHHPMIATRNNRIPVVMAVMHRGIKGMDPDQTDMMAQRETGWMMMECDSGQEVLDTGLMAYKIAEDERVRLPCLFAGDGYILSYTDEPIDIPDEAKVDAFLPPYKTMIPLLPDQGKENRDFQMQQWSIGQDVQTTFIEDQQAMENAKKVIKEVNTEFKKMFGRGYGNGLVEEYKTKDVDAVIIAAGTIASTARVAIDKLQSEGKKVGLVRLKTFKPFPAEEFQRIGPKVKAMGIIDRNISIGSGGWAFGEIRNAMYEVEERPRTLQFHAGLNGKEVRVQDIIKIGEKTLKAASGMKVSPLVEWV
ncbi:MAG: pyruvate ferredoxin oxidoreductase [Candidatus Bathyarchaeia archaeon]|jgi:pyruvate/2-oxoacid:ferredoxin oxidoreductase alpha subunit